jgi:hypothetical protein
MQKFIQRMEGSVEGGRRIEEEKGQLYPGPEDSVV